MIREAESKDREQLSNLYRMLVPKNIADRCIVTKSWCSAIPNESGPINFLNAKDMTAQSAKALKNICNRTFRKT
ncbi:hypothetical protein BCV73_11765 [Paenibacillus sp. SSG-1]|uniref:hypothetical protein n=1 Tax=Paenibacillus sp. SSG-1 TaxID=1443669 RepID=UPI000B7E8CC3|nr:hypothetical protein [Paenibacillus sp. SSG-1]OXL83686.1 hypothetical protein BCV73_11765 [Paenibacillus sp. SSG-1]